MSGNLTRWLVKGVALATLALTGCEAPSRVGSQLYPVSFQSVTDDGEVLPAVNVSAFGRALGSTDERGQLHASLQGRDGDEYIFDVKCPSGYRAPEKRPVLQLRTLHHPGGSELELTCAADKRIAALMVSAPGFGGLPILLHGREIGRTDASGTAHLALRGEPRTPMRVVLDTSSRPRVAPASPHKDVRIGTRDEIVVFAPELTELEPPKPKVNKRKQVEAAPPVALRPEQLN